MRIDGSCHCGAIRFEAEVTPGTVWICHCADCQALTGSAFRMTILAAASSFTLRGQPKIFVRTTEDGFRKRLAFCGTCGSPIYGAPDIENPPTYSLRVGTIRQRAELERPAQQIWCRSAHAWAMVDDVPKAAKQP